MKKNYRGIGFYIGLVLIVILVWYLLGNSQDTAGAYTYAEFEKALDKDEVVAVTIQQNREIPTGVLRITLKNEQSVKLNAQCPPFRQKRAILLDDGKEMGNEPRARKNQRLAKKRPDFCSSDIEGIANFGQYL